VHRLIALLCLCAIAAPAWSLRCGNDIVSEGDSVLLLRERCGPPTRVDRYEGKSAIERYDVFTGRYVIEYVADPYEVWTYNFGPSRFITRIRVRDGVVKSIETGGYGF